MMVLMLVVPELMESEERGTLHMEWMMLEIRWTATVGKKTTGLGMCFGIVKS